MESEIKLIQIQFALIGLDLHRPAHKEYDEINTLLGEPIKAIPTILPTNALQIIPNEIPTVQAFDESSSTRINISNRRIDYFKGIIIPQEVDLFIKNAGLILERYNRAEFERIGIVSQFIIKKQDPSTWLKTTFLKNEKPGWSEISIGYNSKSQMDDVTINHIVKIQDAEAVEAGNKFRCALIHLDINTPINADRKISSDVVKKILLNNSKVFSASRVKEVI